MITKTYLDGRLNQLEENLKRRIEIKDERVSQEIKTDFANLKNRIKLLEEEIVENKDLIRNYIKKQEKPSKNKKDIITSDF